MNKFDNPKIKHLYFLKKSGRIVSLNLFLMSGMLVGTTYFNPILANDFSVVQQKNVRIKGQIFDESTGQPIAGISIRVKDSQRVLGQTGVNGAFDLELPANQVISFDGLGYKSFTTTFSKNQDALNIRLSTSSVELDDVVVTGYQSERKKDITGAVNVVKLSDINQQSTGNAMKSLQGKLPGVSITSNGSPRGAATVRIRGIGTLNDNNPLYIIDGVPTKTGLHTINQLDIESMQVLKDASAASIYGSRAANGVIIITTKRGKKGVTSVDFNSYLAASSYTNRIKMLNTQQYGEVLFKAQVAGNADPNALNLPFEFTFHTDGSGKKVLDNIKIKEYLDPNQTMRTADTDWFDEITKTGITQNYDVSVSRGGETGSSLFSLGYFKNDGIVKESSFSRTSLRFNSDYSFFENFLKVGENFNVVYLNEGGAVPLSESIQAVPMIPVHTVDGKGWGGPWGSMNDRQNPMRIIEDNKQNRDHYVKMLGNFYAEANILEFLKFKSNYGLEYGQDYSRNWQKAYTSGYLVNPLTKLNMNQWHDLKTTWTNTLNYNQVLFDKHTIDGLVGIELYKSRYTNFSASREGYVIENPEFMYLNSGTGQKDNAGYGLRNTLLSYFGKINYAYDNKYLASVTLRHDGSSRFGENYKFGTFPSFSLGWRLSEENLIKNLGIFDELKLRYGWGKTGNQEMDNHGIYDIFSVDYAAASYDLGGTGSGTLPSGYIQTQTGNPNLKWEATTQSNFGLDFSIKNQKIYGSFDYYVKTTEDILLKPAHLAVFGEGGGRWLNGASLENKGLEVMLGSNLRLTEKMNLSLSGNIDFTRNKVTKLPDEVVNSYGGDSRIGENILNKTLGSFYGYVTDGLFKSQEEVDAHGTQIGKGIGRIRYKDLNEDGVINDYDRTWIGVPLPDFSYGFNVGLTYNNFDFSVFLQGIYGVDVHNEVKIWTDFWSATNTGSNKGARLTNAWSLENPNSTIPAIALVDANTENKFSTYYIERGDYLKLRNIQIGYTFKMIPFTRKSNIKSLRLYFNADNLSILSKNKSFTGVDPELPSLAYPNPMVLTGGINLNF